jgi:hypothetical protein
LKQIFLKISEEKRKKKKKTSRRKRTHKNTIRQAYNKTSLGSTYCASTSGFVKVEATI